MLTKCRNTFHFPCEWGELCYTAATLQPRGSCTSALCESLIPWKRLWLWRWQPHGDSSPLLRLARAASNRSALLSHCCQCLAVGGQSDGSAGAELIESQSYRHSPETGVGHSYPCLWHRSAAFVWKHLFPRICLKVISNWQVNKWLKAWLCTVIQIWG